MFRKYISAALISVAVAMLTACGGSSTPTSEAKPTTFVGSWSSDEPSMKAVVKGGVIQIDIVADDTRSLYWKGTFPTSSEENVDFVSDGDTEAMDASLLGSQDPSKTFKYVDDSLTFEMSMVGVTTTVYLKK